MLFLLIFSAGFSGLKGSVASQIIQHFSLHALDFRPIASRNQGKFIGTARHAQLGKQPQEISDSLLCNGQFLVVSDHARSSTIPRVPPYAR